MQQEPQKPLHPSLLQQLKPQTWISDASFTKMGCLKMTAHFL
jgi:hypothetical protein